MPKAKTSPSNAGSTGTDSSTCTAPTASRSLSSQPRWDVWVATNRPVATQLYTTCRALLRQDLKTTCSRLACWALDVASTGVSFVFGRAVACLCSVCRCLGVPPPFSHKWLVSATRQASICFGAIFLGVRFIRGDWARAKIKVTGLMTFLHFCSSQGNALVRGSEHMHTLAPQCMREPAPRDHMQLESCSGWPRHGAGMTRHRTHDRRSVRVQLRMGTV